MVSGMASSRRMGLGFEVGEGLRGNRMFGPCAQSRDAVGQVVGQIGEQCDLVGIERVLLNWRRSSTRPMSRLRWSTAVQ